MDIRLKGTVFFEHVLPSSCSDILSTAVSATQKRLALQDALECKDFDRAEESMKEYSSDFTTILQFLKDNSASVVLKDQPHFDWSWCGQQHMSTCWQYEKLMIHACSSDIYFKKSMRCANAKTWKDANKFIQSSGEHVATIIHQVLKQWVWKEAPSVSMTQTEFWQSKLNLIYALKDMFTLQYGYSNPKGVTINNSMKLLNRAEHSSSISLIQWAGYYNTMLMNWCRVSRAFLSAKKWADQGEYGKAIGLVNTFEPLLEELHGNATLSECVDTLYNKINEVLQMKQEWEQTNNHVHYQRIEAPDLETYIVDDADIKIIEPIK